MSSDGFVERSTNGRFAKGVSGNPAGGNKKKWLRTASGNRILLDDLYMQEAPYVFQQLVGIIFDAATPATARISAIKEFNDRALGKARQTTVLKRDHEEDDVLDLSEVPDEALKALATVKIIAKDK